MAARLALVLQINPKFRTFSKYFPVHGLRWRQFSSSTTHPGNTTLKEHLISRIKASGPLTVAAFMQEVLTNPLSGYYMTNDVFGQAGDFITSPEISQVFGELVGVWFVNQWLLSGKNNIQLVELGPGRGTLASDLLRVFHKFPDLHSKVSLHLVEVSPALSDMQEKTLTGGPLNNHQNHEERQEDVTDEKSQSNVDVSSLCYKRCVSQTGVPASWYRAVQDVPLQDGNCFFVAHEFFDALPVHQFQKTDQGWREIFVDVSPEKRSSQLRFVLAPGPTLASQTLVPQGTSWDQIEVCPQGGVIVEHMSEAIAKQGGCALIVDYGEDVSKRHTLRAFKKHKLHDVLVDPGNADVTANVDFSYLRKATHGKVQTFGPVTQGSFLQQMGIDTRMKILLKNADTSQTEQLQSGYKMLTSAEEMGEKFKFFSLVQHGLPEPAAFR